MGIVRYAIGDCEAFDSYSVGLGADGRYRAAAGREPGSDYADRSYLLPGKGPWIGQVAWLLSLASAPVVGVLMATKQPGNPYGWVWLLYGFWRGGVQTFTESYSIYGLLVAPGSLPLAELGVPLAAVSWLLGIAMLPFVLLLFPSGRLPSPRWRVVAWMTGTALVVGLTVCSVVPGESAFVPVENPFGAAGFMGEAAFVLFDVSLLTIFLMILLSAISPFVRFRRATGVERQQLKWFAYAGVLLLVTQIHQLLPGGNLPEPWDSFEEAVSFALLPVAIGIAVLRYRLWDIDVIIRRTLVYSVLTATLALVYFGSVVLLQGLFTAVGGGKQSPFVIVLSTLAIAALFSPMRGRVQDGIDRRFYRRKYDAAQTLAAFAATARDEVEMERLAAGLLHVIKETMQPAAVSLWLKPTAADPSPVRLRSGYSGQAQRPKRWHK